MGCMDLSDFAPHPDFTITSAFGIAALLAIVVLTILYGDAMLFDTVEVRSADLVNRIGAAAASVLVIGILGVILSGLGAVSASGTAVNDAFHAALQATYGASTDADLPTAERGVSIPVHTPRGTELVTFRQTGGKLVAFRADGTELPRDS